MTRKIILACFLTLMGFTQLMGGRPVFRSLTLEKLVEKSHIVAVVEKRQPFEEKSRRLSENSEELSLPFTIKEILCRKANPVSELQSLASDTEQLSIKDIAIPGKEIDVVFNEVSILDQEFRAYNESGASFRADSYTPSGNDILENNNEVIVFLKIRGQSLAFSAQNAFESTAKKDEVIRIISKLGI